MFAYSRRAPVGAFVAGGLVAGIACLSGCSADQSVRLPPEGGNMSYQLGGAYDPPAGTSIVVRDRHDEPTDGLYNICYVNIFQTQPDDAVPDSQAYGSTAWWELHYPNLLLRASDGELVVDEEWNEALFDVTTPANRAALFTIQKEWILGCAKDGYDGVEADNLDVATRSDSLIASTDVREYIAMVALIAHDSGLSIGQKNAIDSDAGFANGGDTFAVNGEGLDFAIAEECGAYDECAAYVEVYGGLVYDVEYTSEGFEAACASFSGRIGITLRNVMLTAPDSPEYVELSC